MYAAKRSGKGRAVLFDASTPEELVGPTGGKALTAQPR